jgi:hypothetical protein
MPVEIYYNISKIECYYILLRRAYNILIEELLDTNRNILLQIIIKAVNNTTSPNGFILTLLV